MCLIIHKQAGQTVTRHELSRVWERNHDGWGLCYTDEFGAVQVRRGLKLKSLTHAVHKLGATEAFIHLRMATHGPAILPNCHPFEVAPGVYFMHNGVLSIACNANEQRSDTWHFAELVIKPILEMVPPEQHSEFIRSPGFRFLIEVAGKNDRMVLFDRLGGVILNPKSWHTIKERKDGDLLVSNEYAYDEDEFLGKPPKVYGRVFNFADRGPAYSASSSWNKKLATVPLYKGSAYQFDTWDGEEEERIRVYEAETNRLLYGEEDSPIGLHDEPEFFQDIDRFSEESKLNALELELSHDELASGKWIPKANHATIEDFVQKYPKEVADLLSDADSLDEIALSLLYRE